MRKLLPKRTARPAMPRAYENREGEGKGRGDKAVRRRQRRLRSVTGMAHFLAPSNAVSLVAEEGGEFCGEEGGGIHVGITEGLGLNYKGGS